MSLIIAENGAQLASLLILVVAALWYAAPWLQARERAAALAPLLWIHVLRYVALQVYSAQGPSFPISDTGADAIVIGDVAGALLAFLTLVALRYRWPLAIPLAWLLVLETGYDTFENIRGGMREHLLGAASGVTWMILVFYVPLVMVSLGLVLWQLVARRGEALGSSGREQSRHGTSLAGAAR